MKKANVSVNYRSYLFIVTMFSQTKVWACVETRMIEICSSPNLNMLNFALLHRLSHLFVHDSARCTSDIGNSVFHVFE